MLEKRDSAREKKIIEDLISEDEELRRQHEVFQAEMAFKQELIIPFLLGPNLTSMVSEFFNISSPSLVLSNNVNSDGDKNAAGFSYREANTFGSLSAFLKQ